MCLSVSSLRVLCVCVGCVCACSFLDGFVMRVCLLYYWYSSSVFDLYFHLNTRHDS